MQTLTPAEQARKSYQLPKEAKYILSGKCLATSPQIVIENNRSEFQFGACATAPGIAQFLEKLLVGISEEEVVTICINHASYDALHLFYQLNLNGLLRVHTPALGRSGLEVLLELEDLSNQLLYSTVYKNIFWTKCLLVKNGADIPHNVIYGMIIEKYHLLFRGSYSDAPVLSYVPNSNVRAMLNRLYTEEYGHDELLLKSLNQIGISRSDLAYTAPLPETMALCNSLAYWAHNDPLFFFTTLGMLEGADLKQDSFLDAAYHIGINSEFLKPVKTHSDINLKGRHGNLTRKIFTQISVVCEQDLHRMKAQTYLFVELYDQFFSAIWKHYSHTKHLLRRIDRVMESS